MRQISGALGALLILLSTVQAHSADRFFGLLVSEPAWLVVAQEVTTRTDFENKTRIMPIVGSGSVQALQDVTSLRNIDAVLATADSIDYAQRQKLFTSRVAKATEITTLNVILLTKPSIKNLTQLAGKRIATGPAQSAGFATGETLFEALEIPFQRLALNQEQALEALKAGQADAALMLLTDDELNLLAIDKLKIMPLPLPSQVSKLYRAVSIMQQGKSIETLSVPLQLITLQSNQTASVKRFQALLDEVTPATIIPTGDQP